MSGRIQAVGGVLDPNDTAYVLLAMFPLCLFFVQFESGTVKKLVALLAICGAIATVLLTGSRGGLVALGTVLLLLLLTKFGGLSKTPKFLIATVVVLSVAWLLAADRIDAQRYLTMSNISSDYNVTESGGRIALWGEAIDLILDNPITGVGVDCYATANHQARLLRGATYFRWHAVHNSYLQVAAEVGLVGFALFLIICVRTIASFLAAATHKMQSHANRPSEFRALAGLMLLGFVGNLVAGFFLSQGYSIFFTLFFALAAAVAQIHRRASEPLVIPSGAPTPAAVPR